MSLISEAMVATTGFLSPRPISDEDVRLAEALLVSVSTRAAGFIAREKQRPFTMQPQRDVQATRQALLTILTATVKMDAIQTIDPVVGADYLEALEVARETALGCYPIVQVETMAGPLEVDPPEDEQQEWLSILAVLDDVERLVDELEMFALTAVQVEKFRFVYPELHAFLAQVFDEEMGKLMADVPGWALSEDKESALRIFKGMVAEEPIRPRPPAPPLGKPVDGDEAKASEMSAGQRAQFR